MADRDNYRGYGSPSGRYYENREYRPGSDDRERGRSGGGERDDWRDRQRSGGGGDDRGFLERAGEQVRSWFGDDDEDDRGGRERGRHDERSDWRGAQRAQGGDRDRGYGWGSMMAGQGGRDQQRGSEMERGGERWAQGEPWGGGDRGGGPDRSQGHGYSTGRFGSSGGAMGGTRGYRGDDQGRGRGSHPQDDHYHEWRQQQLSELDRDYDEYRREHRDKFHSEFTNWRGQRQQQRQSMRNVTEHMEVIGSDGQPVGTVDKVSGDRIILTKNGAMAGGHHHSIPCSWIQSVDERVTINKTAEQARQQWTDEENRRALFERDDQHQDDGPHILDRSFSGTYEGPRSR